jgi:hypothetical protein
MTNLELKLCRELTFRIRGKVSKGSLQIHRISKIENKDRWACYWSLAYVHPEIGRIFGEDPIDALFQCLDFIGNLIRGSEKDGLGIWWQYEGDHCGLQFTEYPEKPAGEGSPETTKEF